MLAQFELSKSVTMNIKSCHEKSSTSTSSSSSTNTANLLIITFLVIFIIYCQAVDAASPRVDNNNTRESLSLWLITRPTTINPIDIVKKNFHVICGACVKETLEEIFCLQEPLLQYITSDLSTNGDRLEQAFSDASITFNTARLKKYADIVNSNEFNGNDYEIFTPLNVTFEELKQFFKVKEFFKKLTGRNCSAIKKNKNIQDYCAPFMKNPTLATSSTPSPLNMSAFKKTLKEMNIYASLIICMIGLVGNVLSLKVFCSTKLPRTSSRTYLIALAISDGVFLLMQLVEGTLEEIVEHWRIDYPINIIDQKPSICKSVVLLRSVSRAVSPWIIVAFTLERFLVVNFPHHSSIISKPLQAKRIIMIIVTMSVLISLYAPILSGVRLEEGTLLRRLRKKSSTIPEFLREKFSSKVCDVEPKNRSVYLTFTYFYSGMVIILPLIIITVFNALLIARLYKSQDEWMSAKLELHDQEMSYKELRDKKLQIENLKITWTLIIISVTFIVLTLPHTIVYFINHSDEKKKSTTKTSQIVGRISELLYMLNHSVNFFLYIVTRNSFRRVLKEKLKCDCLNWRSYMLNVNKGGNLLFNNCSNLMDQPHSSYCGGKIQSSSGEQQQVAATSNPLTTTAFIDSKATPQIRITADENVADIQDKLQPEIYENYWELVTNKSLLNKSTSDSDSNNNKTGKKKKDRKKAQDANNKSKFEILKRK